MNRMVDLSISIILGSILTAGLGGCSKGGFSFDLLAENGSGEFSNGGPGSWGPGPLPALPPPGSVPGGLPGGHFDLDTSHLLYPLNDGETDHHVHEYDDAFGITGADFFNLLDRGLGNIQETIIDPGKEFSLAIFNSTLSPGGALEINGLRYGVVDYQRADEAAGSPTLYTLGTPARAGVKQLTSLKLSFYQDTLLKGGLIPTATGCVRSNRPGATGEYRNGALIVQARAGGDLLWEATVFWHRDSRCYGDADYVR